MPLGMAICAQEGHQRSMTRGSLHGVIAAIATAIDETGEPDCPRSIALARFLLDNGCDGLNVLGTTGKGTSFSLLQRTRVMRAYAESGLPLDHMLVGTGAAALDDAVVLTSQAATLGFAGALVLPPFYYKGVADDGAVRRHRGDRRRDHRATDPDLPLSFPGPIGSAVAYLADPPPHRFLRRAHRRT